MGKNIDKETEQQINEILSELSICRDDERSSQEQMLQVISTAGAIISACFAISAFLMSGEETNNLLAHDMIYRASLLLTDCTFCTAFSYIIFLGTGNVLRYHFIRDLEDQLARLIYQDYGDALLHWITLSAPVMTKNPKHLSLKYAKLSYFSYAIGVLCACMLGVGTPFLQYMIIQDRQWYDTFLLVVPIAVILLASAAFIFISVRAADMYKQAEKIAKARRHRRLAKTLFVSTQAARSESDDTSMKDFWKIITYFIYPKSKDFQKLLLIPFGAVTGIYLLNGTVTLSLLTEHLRPVLVTILVIDVLIYQARYLWNDICGVREDQTAGKKDRLPIRVLKKKAVSISLAVIILRYVLAAYISIVEQRPLLLLWILLITIIAILYEFLRRFKVNAAIFFVVGLGYPLRFFTGVFTVWPLENLDTTHIRIFVLLALAYTAYGCLSAVLPWTHEAVAEKRKTPNKEFTKSYYDPLYTTICNRISDGNAPLREEGKLSDIWNFACFFATCAAGGILLFSETYMENFPFILLTELLTFGITGTISKRSRKTALLPGLFIITKAVVSILFRFQPLYICVYVHQALFFATYYVLRFYFDPSFNFFNVLIGVIVGKDTLSYLKDMDSLI